MPDTCCVTGRKSNYLKSIKSEGTISVFHFPENKQEKERRISAVPRDDLAEIFANFDEKKVEWMNEKAKKKK
jgi:hypothetical protein